MRLRWLFVLCALVCLLSGSLQIVFAQSLGVTPVSSSNRLAAMAQSPMQRMRAQVKLPRERSQGKSLLADVRAKPAATGANSPVFAGFYGAPFTKGNSQELVIATVGGDFNHDGKPDVATVDTEGNISVLLGDGKGGFGTPLVTQAAGLYNDLFINSVVVADLNGDGYDDLVLAQAQPAGVLLVRLNLKDGTFGLPSKVDLPQLDSAYGFSSYLVGKTSTSSQVNILAFQAYPDSSGNGVDQIFVQTYANDGTGGFTATTSQTLAIPLAQLPFGQMTAVLDDTDNDGKFDLVIELDATSYPRLVDFVDVFRGNGDGTFAATDSTKTVTFPSPTQIEFPMLYSQFFVQPLTSNTKRADLILSNASGVYVALSNGDGTYQTPKQLINPGANQVQFADLNGDGKLDMISTSLGTLVSYLGNGDGTFGGPAGTAAANGDSSTGGHVLTVVADFDGDGKLDFANGNYSGDVEVGHGWGDGSFAATPLLYSATSPEIAPTAFGVSQTLDANGDGLEDLVAQDVDGKILSAISKPGGGFTFMTALSAAANPNATLTGIAADFNGDGKPDLVQMDYDNITLAVSLSNGDGTFQPLSAEVKTGKTLACESIYPAAGDVNGDGKMDLVFIYGGDASCGGTGTVPSGYFVAFGNGDGTFAPAAFQPMGNDLLTLTLARFHGAGKPLDLILEDWGYPKSTPQVSILAGKGDGTFGEPATINSGDDVFRILTDDFNGDGKPDLTLVAFNGGVGGKTLQYAGHGDGTFADAVDVSDDVDLGGVYADVNNDGIIDLIGQKEYGSLEVLLGTGGGKFVLASENYTGGLDELLFAGRFQGDNSVSILVQTENGFGTAFFMNQGGTTLTAVASAAMINSGDTETLTADLTPSVKGLTAPTGTVTLYDGTVSLGSGPVGSASVVTAGLAVGTHSITAKYSGDGFYYANTSPAITVTVSTPPPPPAPDFTFSSSASTLSVAKGSSGALTLTVNTNASLSATVTFACSGLPTESACTFAPASLTVAAGASGSDTVTVSTKAASASVKAAKLKAAAKAEGTSLPGRFAGMGVAAAGLALLVLPKRRKWLLPLVLLACGGLASFSGCGGSKGSTTPPPPVDPGTPAGMTNVTVTATAVSGGTTVTHTMTIALTVQ